MWFSKRGEKVISLRNLKAKSSFFFFFSSRGCFQVRLVVIWSLVANFSLDLTTHAHVAWCVRGLDAFFLNSIIDSGVGSHCLSRFFVGSCIHVWYSRWCLCRRCGVFWSKWVRLLGLHLRGNTVSH